MKHFIMTTALAIGLGAASVPGYAQTTLNFGSAAPGPAPINAALEQWSADVSAASEGTLSINFVSGGVLGKDGQLFDRVTNGVVDIAWEVPAFSPGRFPGVSVTELPDLYSDAGDGSVALQAVYEEGHFGDEFAGVKILALFVFPTPTLMTKEPVATLADIEGMPITSGNATRQKMLEALGATPVSMPIYEWYQGMNRGVIDGVAETMSVAAPFRLVEVVNHYVTVPMGGVAGMVFMNEAKYDALPDAAKAAIDANSGAVLARYTGDTWQAAANAGVSIAEGMGHEIGTLPEAELMALKEAVAPVVVEWKASTPNGAAILEAFRAANAAVNAN